MLPAFVSDRSLVIASSYSGNTEETLIGLEQALEAGATFVAITSGGKLAQWAKETNAPVVTIDYEAQPRAVLGYSLILTLGVLQRLGLIADPSAQIHEAADLTRELQAQINERVPEMSNPAKQLALKLHGRVPVVYGSGYLSAVARRWKGQFNENAKNWAFFEEMPELNHNAVVGYEWPEDAGEHITVIMLRCDLDHPRNAVRFEVTEEILKMQKIPCEVVHSRGRSPLASMLYSIHFGDYVSYYLAMLNEANPTPVRTIAYLKRRLAEHFAGS